MKMFIYTMPFIIIGGVSYISYKIGKDIFNAKIECNKLNILSK